MAKLDWNKPGERYFEAGLDRGVFYPEDGPGVAWIGLTAVNETPDGGDASSYYLDGDKYLDKIAPEDFGATIEAFNYPPEFIPYDGMAQFRGLTVTGQPRRKFGMSYRTLVGNDTQGTAFAYKIHLVYEAMVLPTDRPRKTVDDSVELMSYSWNMVATPVGISGRRKTAHYIVDTRDNDMNNVLILEDYLYGSDTQDPQLLMPIDISEILTSGALSTTP